MATYHINHRTTCNYEHPVAVSHHSACLTPRTEAFQTCQYHNLSLTPHPVDLLKRKDYFGNTVHLFSIQDTHDKLILDSNSEVKVTPLELPIPQLTPTCQEVLKTLTTPDSPSTIDATQYLDTSPHISITESIRDFARPFYSPDITYLEFASTLASHIHDTFTFDPTATDNSTPLDTVLEQKRGVCQDFAHLLIAALRSMKLPARYVSGYILTEPPEGQTRLTGADASHAWVSIFLPNYGWIDIDPTNAQYPVEEHITVAVGRDFSDVSMLRGAVTGGGTHTLDISVTVTPLTPPTSPRHHLTSSKTT